MDFFADLPFQLSPSHLFEDPSPVTSGIYVDLVFLLAFTMLFGVLASVRPQLFVRDNTFHQQIMRQYGGWVAWLSGVGVVLIGLRYTNAPFFSKRLWTAADLIALLVVAAHFARYRLSSYGDDLAGYQEEQRRRHFRTGAPAPSRRRRRR